jgi:hypothetical protein
MTSRAAKIRCALMGHDYKVRILAKTPITCRRCGAGFWLSGERKCT